MRRIAMTFGLGILIALSGCSSTKFSWMKNNDHAPAPSNGKEPPSVADLVKYLNYNAARIESLRVDELGITASMGIQSFDFRGSMATERGKMEEAPKKNFRLITKFLGNPAVNIGSNDQEFWFWISKADPPHQYFCSYRDLSEGRVKRMPIPFQPEMVMESLGMGPYGPADKYKLEADAKSLRLVERTTTPDGRQVRKVIVFNPTEVKVPTPQVTDYLLLDDATGKEICGAHIREAQKIDNAYLPKRIELRCPSEKMQLALRLDGVTLNPLLSAQMFTRRTMSDIPSFNLARGQVDNTPPPQAFTGIRAAQGP